MTERDREQDARFSLISSSSERPSTATSFFILLFRASGAQSIAICRIRDIHIYLHTAGQDRRRQRVYRRCDGGRGRHPVKGSRMTHPLSRDVAVALRYDSYPISSHGSSLSPLLSSQSYERSLSLSSAKIPSSSTPKISRRIVYLATASRASQIPDLILPLEKPRAPDCAPSALALTYAIHHHPVGLARK